MKIFQGWVEGFEKLVEMFERISDNLPRIEKYAVNPVQRCS